MMTWSIAILLALAATGSEELVQNPGFETVLNGKPAQWNLFVQKEPGAEGKVDDTVALDGTRSVMLHNPDTYQTEPFNNWSQNILHSCRGKRLAVGGHVKTESVGGAAIWLQCWQRSPLQVVYVTSTTETTPITGTMDWTPIVMELMVPDTTDFLVVRCVIKGPGTAWFDSITVRDAESFTTPPPPVTSDTTGKTDATPDATLKSGSEAALKLDAQTAANALQEVQSLSETVRSLRASNASLTRELAEIRKELALIRQQLMYVGNSQLAPQLAPQLSPQSLQQLQPGLSPEYLLPRTTTPKSSGMAPLLQQWQSRQSSNAKDALKTPMQP